MSKPMISLEENYPGSSPDNFKDSFSLRQKIS